jgi:hypothetical protein
MKILIKGKENFIATILIGKKFFKQWEKNIYPSWKVYCKKNKLGLVIFNDHLISKKNPFWKKPTWQKMLIGENIIKSKKKIKNICYLDADVLINPYSPNIFQFHHNNKISLISSRKNLPYDYYHTVKKISFYRKQYFFKEYPLNTALLFTNEETYKYHNLDVMEDEACMGVFIFNVKRFHKHMKDWFFKYKSDVKSFTGGGDQIHFNYEIQSNCKVNWIDYRFQCIWNYEMANHYPFLYEKKFANKKIVKKCIENSLFNNFFLHFAGSWHESKLLYHSEIKLNDIQSLTKNKLNRYLKSKVKAKPRKRILPKI